MPEVRPVSLSSRQMIQVRDTIQRPLLSANNITKSYEGVDALRGVSFELLPGEVHALVGENGAGKSTLIKIITGAVQADSGVIEIDGEIIGNNSPAFSKSVGIAAIYQQPALFPELSVSENLTLGLREAGLFSRIDWKEKRTLAKTLLERIGATIDPDRDVRELSMPEQQLVEIARALGSDARVLIMDEPTASLAEEETQNLYRVIGQLRDAGVGIIYISHRLEELAVIADRVTVLRDGAVVGTRLMRDIGPRELIQLMVGRDLSAVFPKREVQLGDVVLELRNLGCQTNGLYDVNLSVRAGEIVGLAGLVGAGRTELAQTLFGLQPKDTGQVVLRDKVVEIQTPSDSIALGLAYVPEDRRRHGVVLDMPVKSNITLASLRKLSSLLSFNFSREKQIAAQYVKRLLIKTPSIFAAVASLSGGNQQKVALSRWLETKPKILILDEPTQGIDVGAKAEIHALMSDLAEQGTAILMISSELPEILGMSDRIFVMRHGTVVAELTRAEATQQRVMELALGHQSVAA